MLNLKSILLAHLALRAPRLTALRLPLLTLILSQSVTFHLQAQPSATSPVLDLDGKTGYVELPPNTLDDLDEATVEAWVKWRSFATNFGRGSSAMGRCTMIPVFKWTQMALCISSFPSGKAR